MRPPSRVSTGRRTVRGPCRAILPRESHAEREAQAMPGALEQRVVDDLAAAMRSGDDDRKRTLRLLRAALKNAEIEARSRGKLAAGDALADDAVVGVVQHQAKQRRDAIDLYRQGGRDDLRQQEERELAILEAYLPSAVPVDEIEPVVQAQIAALGATGPADIGKVMGAAVQALQARADGRLIDRKLVSDTVRRLLAG
ncbi:glutamyl-tRNA amidotransferase [bacterium]|nr:GatB/YqeY domain-containing protein [Chloroflexi bacterium CFX6]RIL11852.1 MAG: glutamyl-tRNA amidotransferase [bacterium]